MNWTKCLPPKGGPSQSPSLRLPPGTLSEKAILSLPYFSLSISFLPLACACDFSVTIRAFAELTRFEKILAAYNRPGRYFAVARSSADREDLAKNL
jgi:hypothetical protein